MENTEKQIRIGIVEDNKKIANSLELYLNQQPNMLCVLNTGTAEKMIEYLKSDSIKPDVILMDIQLPGMSGIKAIQIIKYKYIYIDIMMLTIYHDSHKIFDSLCAGASGYLLKHTSLLEIKNAIIALVKYGGSPMSPQIARRVVKHFHNVELKSRQDKQLTRRELDIVQGLIAGLSYKLIASRYNISIDTVRAHIRHIYKKLHVNSRGEVVAKSFKGEI